MQWAQLAQQHYMKKPIPQIIEPKGDHVPGVPLDKEKVKAAILEARGNITRAAMALKCARYSITRIVSTNPDVKEILDEARERTVDEVEDAFLKKALSGTDTTAQIFFLKTRARDRGYDQGPRIDNDNTSRQALDFALNKSRNPAHIDPESK